MADAPEKQDANLVGFYKAREAALGKVPAIAAWDTREPNSFDDLGAEYTKVARKIFSGSRQRKKGSTTDMDADGGYNEDLTQHNMQSELEEFFFARIRATASFTAPVLYAQPFTVNAATDTATKAGHGLANGDGPFQVTAQTTLAAGLTALTNYWVGGVTVNTFKFATSRANALAGVFVDMTDTGTGTQTLTRTGSVSTTDDSYTVNDVPDNVVPGSVLYARGYTAQTNNGRKVVGAVSASKVTVTTNLMNESSAPAGATLKVVGHAFAAGDLVMTALRNDDDVVTGFTIDMDAATLAQYDLVPGSWMFIGSDAPDSYFVDADGERVGGYARIGVDGVSDDGKTITFDKSTFPPEDNDGAGKAVVIYFGDVIKNEDDPDLIVRFSSVMERTLGRDADGRQSEYLTGVVASELTWNSPLANLVNIDMAYIAQKAGLRKGIDGPLVARPGNTIRKALGEEAFNTSSNVYRLRMGMIDPNTLNPAPLFARVTEWTGTINNNVSSSKAQGVLGGFDTTVGNFDNDIELTAYFSTVDAIHAVKCNWDVTFDAIYAKANAGIYYDVPLVSLGGGRLDIEQDAAIMIPLTAAAAESPFGHTALIGWFDYLPNAAMPDIDC